MDKLVKAQIAALQNATMDENKHFRSDYDKGKAVDALLDSLQEEPVSEDLQKVAAAIKYSLENLI